MPAYSLFTAPPKVVVLYLATLREVSSGVEQDWIVDDNGPPFSCVESPSGPPLSLRKPKEAQHIGKKRGHGMQSQAALSTRDQPRAQQRVGIQQGRLRPLRGGEGAGQKPCFSKHEYLLPQPYLSAREQRRCAPRPKRREFRGERPVWKGSLILENSA